MNRTGTHVKRTPHSEHRHPDRRALRDLMRIPGVGKSLAADLIKLGYYKVEDLKGEDSQEMYERLCALSGKTQDRCVLYVFRCAVYFAQESHPDPELLKWWNWKDGRSNVQSVAQV